MAYLAPTAPSSFYDDGLDLTKTHLATGRLVLLDAMPADINSGWAEVGVADDSTQAGLNVGTAVLGFANIGTITGPVDGDVDPGDTGSVEAGRKLQFTAVADVSILENANSTAIALALVKKVATNAAGVGSDLVYIVDIDDIALDGTPTGVTINLNTFEIEIKYAVNKV